MFKFKTRLKKWLVLSSAALGVGLLSTLSMNVNAQEESLSSSTLLAEIVVHTRHTAEGVYTLLSFLNNWMLLADKSDLTKQVQSQFTTLTSDVIKNASTQNATQLKLTQDFLQNVPLLEINDITYESLLGQLYISPDPRGEKTDVAYNYIKNAAGLNIRHVTPDERWEGEESDKKAYKNFYTTISSIQTYSAYLLGQMYADVANGTNLTEQQNKLMQQASSPAWLTDIASENIALVLRQILMYNSQIYVTLTQLLQTQKQSLAAQAMTNTLIVLGNQFTETQLVSKARKKQPRG